MLVTSPQGELTPFGMVPKYSRFRVVGIFNSGFYDYDSSWAFTRLSDAQRLFGLGDLISVIEFKIDDIYKANEVFSRTRRRGGQGLHDHELDGTESGPVPRTAPGTTGHLHHHRIDRLRRRFEHPDFADHDGHGKNQRHRGADVDGHAQGASAPNIFIAQGVLIGVIGTAIGLLLGYAISYAGGHYHIISLSPEVYSIDYVPFAPRPMDGLLVAVVAIGVSFSPRFILRGPQVEPFLRKRCATSSELILKRPCRSERSGSRSQRESKNPY